MTLHVDIPDVPAEGTEAFTRIVVVTGLTVSVLPPALLIYSGVQDVFIPRFFEDLLAAAGTNPMMTKLTSLAATFAPFLLARSCFHSGGAINDLGKACVALALLGIALSVMAGFFLNQTHFDDEQLPVLADLVSHSFSVSVFFVCTLLGLQHVLREQ